MASNNARISKLESQIKQTMAQLSTIPVFQDRTLYNSTLDPSFNNTNTNNIVVTNNAVIKGSMTVTGTTTTLNTENVDISDNLIGLNRNGPTRDSGMVIERTDASNVFIGWKNDNFTFGKTNDNASSSSVSVTTGTLHMNVVGDVTGDITGDVDGNATQGSVLDQRITTLDNSMGLVFTNLEGEKSRALAAEGVLDTSISILDASVNALEAHDDVLDGSINAINSIVSTLGNAVSTLDDSMNNLDASMNAVFTNLEGEKSRAQSAEQALDASIVDVEDRTSDLETHDSVLDASMAVINNIVSNLGNAVNALDNSMNNLDASMNAVFTNLEGEKSRAIAAEGVLDNSVNALDASMNAVITDLATEKSRAEGAEQALDASMNAVFTNFALTSYVDAKVSDLVNSSPDALNTLNELAVALGNDANFSTTILNNLIWVMP